MFRFQRWLLLCIPLCLAACADDGSCAIATIGDLEVLNTRGSPIVRASVNGHPVAFIVDTGAVASSVWPQQVDRLDLSSSFRQVRLRGTGGETTGTVVTASAMGLGAATTSDVTFVAVGRLMNGRTIDGLPIVGLFGADFLSNYDVVFDLPDHRINLYGIHGCKGLIPRWSGTFYKVPTGYSGTDESKIIVRIKLNGHPIDAILDSGAQGTLIAADDARAAGVRKADMASDRKGIGFGIDDEKLERFMHRFDSLELGPFHYSHPFLSVGETTQSLLGAEFLRHNRVWIPRSRDWIYVQPVATHRLAGAPAPP
ncbi:aspartyl protease family protein, partial [Gluconacetobacter sacchari]|uniref:aspartyl protease family protein n=1 Tax=Gluconacetobacter sacchari TaxID=92759 RepID=UPI00223094C9